MKRYFFVFVIGLLLGWVLLIFINGKEEVEKFEVGFYDACVYEEVEDGWIFSMCKTIDKSANDLYGFKELFFYGDNLTYTTLEGYFIPVYDDDDNLVDKIDVKYPSTVHNFDSQEENELIVNFLNEKKFKETIDIDVFDELDFELNIFDLDMVARMYNRLLKMEYKEDFGTYLLPSTDLITIDNIDGSTWQIGYILSYGYIEYVNLEYINDEGLYSTLNGESEPNIELNSYISNIELSVITTGQFKISAEDIKCPTGVNCESLLMKLSQLDNGQLEVEK